MHRFTGKVAERLTNGERAISRMPILQFHKEGHPTSGEALLYPSPMDSLSTSLFHQGAVYVEWFPWSEVLGQPAIVCT